MLVHIERKLFIASAQNTMGKCRRLKIVEAMQNSCFNNDQLLTRYDLDC